MEDPKDAYETFQTFQESTDHFSARLAKRLREQAELYRPGSRQAYAQSAESNFKFEILSEIAQCLEEI